MNARWLRIIALVSVGVGLLGMLPGAGLAQDGGTRTEFPALGVAFDLPPGWEVEVTDNQLMAAAPGDLVTAQEGGAPAGLVVRLITGTFNELGITDAAQIPDQLARLVPGTVAAPAPVPAQWGNGEGYEMLVQLPEGLTTRVGLLALPGGRVAIVRGLAPTPAWDTGAGAAFEALINSLAFSLPEREAGFMDQITANDGGILWHYQEAQPESGRVVRLGGIVYDSFDLMYVTAGPGGVLVLDQNTANQVSFIGPWLNGDFVDVAIGPDTRLYLANAAAETDQAVMVVDRAGNYDRGWGARGDGAGQFAPGMPQTIASAANGDVWAVSEGHGEGVRDRLYRFDSIGNLLLTVDLATINPDLSGARLAANPVSDGLWIVGATGSLNAVDARAEPLVVNLAQDVLADTAPVDIALARNGNIILALDAPGLEGSGLLEISPAGALLDAFGFVYDAARGGPFLPGEYLRPAGLVIGTDGTGYWAETHPQTGYNQVQRFTFTGDGRLPLGRETVEAADAPAGALTADPAFGSGTLAYGDTVLGALNNRYPSHTWTFEGAAGDAVVITMRDASGAGLLDPQLSLKNAEGIEIAANDDVGAVRPADLGERDSRIEFVLPAAGVYTIQATRFGGRGEYVLTLARGG